jgi:hypothetical protein
MIRHLLETQKKVLQFMLSALTRLDPISPDKNPTRHNNYVPSMHDVRFGSGSVVTIASYNSNDVSDSVETTKALAQNIASPATREHLIFADETLTGVLAEVNSINADAEYTHRMVSKNAVFINCPVLTLPEATRSTRSQIKNSHVGRGTILNQARPSCHAIHHHHRHIRELDLGNPSPLSRFPPSIFLTSKT